LRVTPGSPFCPCAWMIAAHCLLAYDRVVLVVGGRVLPFAAGVPTATEDGRRLRLRPMAAE